jgi:hypothetical protein
MARVEVAVAEIPRIIEPEVRERVVAGLRALGYKFVTIDLEGLRSGSLNRGVPGITIAEPSTGSAQGASEAARHSARCRKLVGTSARMGDITVAPHGGGGRVRSSLRSSCALARNPRQRR